MLKSTQMGPLLVLVCPCFRENVIVTCKIVSFLCSLDNFLLKNVIVFFFGNQISELRSFEKKNSYFWPTFHIFSHQGRSKNSFSIYLTYIHIRILLTLLILFVLPILQKLLIFLSYGFSLVWLLMLILFRAILEQSIITNWWAEFRLECLLLICIYTNGNL